MCSASKCQFLYGNLASVLVLVSVVSPMEETQNMNHNTPGHIHIGMPVVDTNANEFVSKMFTFSLFVIMLELLCVSILSHHALFPCSVAACIRRMNGKIHVYSSPLLRIGNFSSEINIPYLKFMTLASLILKNFRMISYKASKNPWICMDSIWTQDSHFKLSKLAVYPSSSYNYLNRVYFTWLREWTKTHAHMNTDILTHYISSKRIQKVVRFVSSDKNSLWECPQWQKTYSMHGCVRLFLKRFEIDMIFFREWTFMSASICSTHCLWFFMPYFDGEEKNGTAVKQISKYRWLGNENSVNELR